MKIYLDLLPDYRKQEIKRKNFFHAILGEEMLFLVPVILFILILLNVYYVLVLQKNSSISENSSQQSQGKYQQLGIYQEKFKKINDLDQVLDKIQLGHLYWINLFQKLNEATPNSIQISNLSTKNYTVFLVGKAKTRDDLLNFKNKLGESTCFQNINVPLSNLVVKDNVDFQIDLTLNKDCLKEQ